LSALRSIRAAGGGAGGAAADADAEEEEEASKLEGSLRLAGGTAEPVAVAAAAAASASGGGRLRPELQIETMSSPNLDILDGPKPLIRLSSAVERGQAATRASSSALVNTQYGGVASSLARRVRKALRAAPRSLLGSACVAAGRAGAGADTASASGGGQLSPELQIDTMSSPNFDILDGPNPLIRLSSVVERGQVATWLGLGQGLALA